MRALLSREARLLMLAAGGPENDGRIRSVAAGGIEWETTVALARMHGATSVLWRRLQRLGIAVPTAVAAEMHRATVLSEFTLQRARARLVETVGAFTAAGIPVTLLKGAAVAETAYDAFVQRPMRDFDLLVDPERIEEANSVACANGWTRSAGAASDSAYALHHHIAPLIDTRGTGMHLELHRSLFMSGHPFELPPLMLRRRSRPVDMGGLLVGVPVRSVLLLHACLHFAWSHALRSGAWRTIRDVARLTASCPAVWEELVRLAIATRGTTCCYWTLRLARDLTHVPVPEAVLAALEPPIPEVIRSRIVRHFALHLTASDVACPSVALDLRMWALAVRPAWSGHGAARPWDRKDEFLDAGESQAWGANRAGAFMRHVTRIPAWTRYLGAVLPSAPIATAKS